MSGSRNPTPPSSGGGAGTPACDSTITSCPLLACNRATITSPQGSQSAGANPIDSWLLTPCFHFDFQGVVGGAPGSYVLRIAGNVDPAPPYTCQWDLEPTAGLLTNATSPTPTHTEPNTDGEGVLKLTGMNGATVGACEARKRLKVYQDHLARDYDNFGVGISCDLDWSFTHLGATISMKARWNCHGGTLHIYNGGGTGQAGFAEVSFLLHPSRLKKTVQVTHTPTGGGTHPPLGPLNRGDIVAYFTGAGVLAHTQTCTGSGTETYGANNVPLRFPGRPGSDEAWEWAASPAGDWANNLQTDLFPGATPFTIKVFSRP